MVQVAGVLRLPPGRGSDFARVRVSIRDVTEADGPATTVASVDLPSAHVPGTGADLPFTIEAELDPRRTYVVRAHADRSGSGAVEPGDFVTTTAQPVGPATPPTLVVPLQQVGS